MELVVQTIAQAYREVHASLRRLISSLDTHALRWTPGPNTNSIAVLVVHTLGSEAEVWHIVAGVPFDRDRASEFVVKDTATATLLARLDDTDRLLDELAPAVTADDLSAVKERRDHPPQMGIYWLVTNYGHAREHLAHIELTRQLYSQSV